MQKISYNGLEIDVGTKSSYHICLPVYSGGGVEVLMRPLSGVYVIFDNGRKARSEADIAEILRKHGGAETAIREMEMCNNTLGTVPRISMF
jgi:hypothetical protein